MLRVFVPSLDITSARLCPVRPPSSPTPSLRPSRRPGGPSKVVGLRPSEKMAGPPAVPPRLARSPASPARPPSLPPASPAHPPSLPPASIARLACPPSLPPASLARLARSTRSPRPPASPNRLAACFCAPWRVDWSWPPAAPEKTGGPAGRQPVEGAAGRLCAQAGGRHALVGGAGGCWGLCKAPTAFSSAELISSTRCRYWA